MYIYILIIFVLNIINDMIETLLVSTFLCVYLIVDLLCHYLYYLNTTCKCFYLDTIKYYCALYCTSNYLCQTLEYLEF